MIVKVQGQEKKVLKKFEFYSLGQQNYLEYRNEWNIQTFGQKYDTFKNHKTFNSLRNG